MRMQRNLLLAGAIAAALLSHARAQAQALEEIIVTAERRETRKHYRHLDERSECG